MNEWMNEWTHSYIFEYNDIQSFILIIKYNKSFITILRDDANSNLADQEPACFSESSDVFAVELIKTAEPSNSQSHLSHHCFQTECKHLKIYHL